MQAVITHPAGVEAGIESVEATRAIPTDLASITDVVNPSSRLTAADRIRIYASAYYGRLIDCLREEFAVFAKMVGEDAFNAFAFDYLQSHPSRSYTLNDLGRHFPTYLRSTRPAADAPADGAPTFSDLITDMASLEWTINEVFDAPGVEGEPLPSAADLLAITADRLASVRLEPVPCLRLLSMRFPVNAFFTAIRGADDADLPAPPDAQPEYLAVFRRDFIVRRFEVSRPQFELLTALCKSMPLAAAIEIAAASWKGDDESFAASLRSWFESWTTAGLIHRAQ